ncbi:hypothetical protein [Melittangium boletus]|uniref:Lipoprotein n=1 Tax=Melittangium boletus DSM 14713 TaxID=1294270 RepID=A0A250IBV8_9BACT|nr:hypothetical protein [Melittangium boletus]ATB29329.1 hypothetical protein MEBOL_002778 [Melittangium boletus DSM 14713]
MNVKAPSTARAVALALALSACGEDKTPEVCAEPLYGGKATDEAWRALVDVSNKPLDTSGSVYLASPTEGEVYPAGAPAPTWAWSLPQALRPTPPAPRPRAFRPLEWLGDWLLPSAHAHLPPYTGEIYWAQVFTPDRACPVAQILTSELTWQPDAESWAVLGQHAGKTLTLQVTRAYLLQNTVTEGPYRLDPPRAFRRSAP